MAAVALFLGVVLIGQLAQDKDKVSADPGPQASRSATEPLDIARREANDPMALGDVDAPVVLIEWTDLRCPFCAAFHRDSLPSILTGFVDAGLVRLEVRDVAFFGEQSEMAAVAARAAGRQGKYHEYIDAVYQAAPGKGHADLPQPELLDFARQAGVPDMERFADDLSSEQLRAEVQRSTSEAHQLGINSVPFFVAGNLVVSGAQPTAVFTDFLDEALAKAQ